MSEPKALVVDATQFTRRFSQFRREANEVDIIEITSHGQVVGGYLSAAQLEHFRRLKRREREVFRVGELPDELVADLEASLTRYGSDPED